VLSFVAEMRFAFLLLFVVGCATAHVPVSTTEYGKPTELAPLVIRVTGRVKRPGIYPWHLGMTIGDVLTIAGGPTPDARFVSLARGDPRSTWPCSTFSIPEPGSRMWAEGTRAGETIAVESQSDVERHLE
jgi:hypothetical protein